MENINKLLQDREIAVKRKLEIESNIATLEKEYQGKLEKLGDLEQDNEDTDNILKDIKSLKARLQDETLKLEGYKKIDEKFKGMAEKAVEDFEEAKKEYQVNISLSVARVENIVKAYNEGMEKELEVRNQLDSKLHDVLIETDKAIKGILKERRLPSYINGYKSDIKVIKFNKLLPPYNY